MFENARKTGHLTADDKSKKLKQLRKVMSDNTNFVFQNNTVELNRKIEQRYFEAVSQIADIKKGY